MTDARDLYPDCKSFLNTLCVTIAERCVGSEGNREATRFFEKNIRSLGWKTKTQEFNAIDWIDGGAALKAKGLECKVLVSPYSLGCSAKADLVAATTMDELERLDCSGKLLLLYGEIAKEQLMPKNFVFYNPEEHFTFLKYCARKFGKLL